MDDRVTFFVVCEGRYKAMGESLKGRSDKTMEIGARWIAAVLTVLISLTIYSDAESARKKDREVSGLYPFPRVGRRDNFDAAFTEFIKRQGLIPFPRVGRTNIKPKPEGIENENWVEHQQNAFQEKPNEWALIQLQGSPQKNPSNIGKDKESRGGDSSNLDSNESFLPSQIMAW